MTTLPEEAVKSMPERIYAKVHGASTDVIRGQRGLIGGWNEHKRDGQIEYLRSDLIATYQAAVLEKAVQIAERPVIGFSDGAVEASKYIASSIRALSSPDHADAGKVEGDGWLPIESAPRDGTSILAVCAGVHERTGIPFIPEVVEWTQYGWSNEMWGEQPNHGAYCPSHWRPLPSAPSPEVA